MWASKKSTLRPPRGAKLLVPFLLATLALTLWLGVQALSAARSHRQTVDAVLREYADLAAHEFVQRFDENLGDVYRLTFDDVPWSSRGRFPPPSYLANDFSRVLRDQDCRCTSLREEARFFRIDLSDSTMVWAPEEPTDIDSQALLEELTRPDNGGWDHGEGLFLIPSSDATSEGNLAVGLWVGTRGGQPGTMYGVVAGLNSFGELFDEWVLEHTLVPMADTETESLDSLIQISISGPGDVLLYRSPNEVPDEFSARDTIPDYAGIFVTEARIRPEAAQHLVLGNLPRDRIPLLLGLIVLTLGVGAGALIQLRREQQLTKLRDDFVSSVSHEFRTPLTQIQIFADLLDSGRVESDEKKRWCTGVIKREARRLTHLVANVLHFSPTRGAPHLSSRPAPMNVAAAVDEAVDGFLPLAEDAKATLLVEVPEDLTVVASRPDLHRVIANLVDNALKYGPEGQTVRIQGSALDDSVEISIQDEGPGIDEADHKRVFFPYFRLDRDREGPVQGSGIGLALVAELVDLMGGRIRIESTGASGSRFVIQLPAASDVANLVPASEESSGG